ncbi:YqiA/YcfP family alpha/beta fold hydrolase [Acinetobacter faecalis]|uniref:YqiA/YcfP family alpha/beta fold hydrolase n=1 Tax=Acinetobacter faecalis TaxID=2665161 RepID=UPI002A909554|nr:YqiA/YcfP family alpha/beta fold hydrolase [Acinetobacter faecalis]MDY6467106.1 YqiA/YcfP family alpha/beta fold hydrolase [Acinetobacter faecalis]MDY6481100.1 YqiA/YcfP family alpha/beta fold hydrolase [Acinetobacter faecalis]
MTTYTSTVLFFHGLDSSRDSTKFHAIDAPKKYCINVDYRNLNFETVAQFYHDIIEKINPHIIVGHSLGGYWALLMSFKHQIPCVIANPNLTPNFRDDYPPISDKILDHDIQQMAYLELGDEILDMHGTKEFLENYMQIQSIEGGHHRLEHPERINDLILEIEKSF